MRPASSPFSSLLPACRITTAAALLAASGSGSAQQSIFTCIDTLGRRLTSDRPIAACLDREQRELSSSGAVKRVIPPTLTASERTEREARQRQIEEERQRALEIAHADQAMLARYPNPAAHEAARREALSRTQTAIDAAEQRIASLARERQALDNEMEFYAKNPAKAPAKLRLGFEDNTQAVEKQRQTIAGQQDERKRINSAFDEEAKRLQPLWDARAASATAVSARMRNN
jgi:chromosome segregation ATPase